MLKGFPSWNVPLAHTLNKLPPQVHQNGLPGQSRAPAKVEAVHAIDLSSFVLTAAKDGSINIWNTKSRL
jgi:hypothetical protein